MVRSIRRLEAAFDETINPRASLGFLGLATDRASLPDFRAFVALGCERISLLVPYLLETAEMVADHFEAAGFRLDSVATFDLGGDPEMNRVDPKRVIEAGIEMCDQASDGLFVSCTGWQTASVIEPLETALRCPVVTSNQALAWKALRTAGVSDQCDGSGRLFSET